MKQIVPEIYVNRCREALDFYRSIFGGEVKNLQMADDLPLFTKYKGKVVHSELHVNNRCIFYFVDALGDSRPTQGNITVLLHLDSRRELEEICHGLAAGGSVSMEPQETFWGGWHAIVTDQYGAPWALSWAPPSK